MGNTILIADDDKATLGMLGKCFTSAGYTVYTAETCDDAIRLASQYLPDCFLLDYYMGAGTIVPVCRFIRSHPQLKNSPIVMLSGDSEQADNGYDSCHVDLFLEKGGSCRELLAAMRHLLRRADPAVGIVQRSELTLDPQNMSISREGKFIAVLSTEQYRFLSILFNRSSQFVNEREMLAYVFSSDPFSGTRKALDMVAYRLRAKLGQQLARRIKSSKARGWVYIQPRDRRKYELAAEKNSLHS